MDTCSICLVKGWLFYDLRSNYSVHGFKTVCPKCGDKANSFVNYWGKKKLKDKVNLKMYLNGGIMAQRKYSQLINAGYC